VPSVASLAARFGMLPPAMRLTVATLISLALWGLGAAIVLDLAGGAGVGE
jgi:hypothetical protein